jgi:hypothetical protein
LGSFATGREPTTDGPIGRQQEVLAVDDLVSFAIHARRLIENTASPKRFTGVALELYHKPSETIAITRVINKLVHHRDIEIVRNVFKLRLLTAKDPIKVLSKYGKEDRKSFAPIVMIRSDNNLFTVFELTGLIETFQEKILCPIINICDDNKLFLDDDF